MKKYLSLPALGLFLFISSCNTKPAGSISATAQKNLDVMHAITQTFESKDFSKIGDYIAVDAVDHAGDNGDIKGLDSIKASFVKSVTEFDSQKSEVIKELADDDYVMSWEHFIGTYKADGKGHKAGDKLDLHMVDVAKFKDGKAVEHWVFMDPSEMMKMMAPMSPAPMSMPADSAKKKM